MNNGNIAKIIEDLDALLHWGKILKNAWDLQWCHSNIDLSEEQRGCLKGIDIADKYQAWYSKALIIIKQFLPCRLDEFVGLYEYKGNRKTITPVNYRISDVLLEYGYLSCGNLFGPQDLRYCLNLLARQCSILAAARESLVNSWGEIRQGLQTDLLDSEIDAARRLSKNGFPRAAGAIAGVVLERHLNAVIGFHEFKMSKESPGIKDYAQKLEDEGVIDFQTCRLIQSLGNSCDLCCNAKGPKKEDPKKEDVEELIAGVDRIIKTVF